MSFFCYRRAAVLGMMGVAVVAIAEKTKVSVANPWQVDHCDEVIEVDASRLHGHAPFVVLNASGDTLPSQLTHDGKLLFVVSLKAGKGETFTVATTDVQPAYSTVACGKVYTRRLDGGARENGKAGNRAYGPALQRRGEKAFGYDIFTKSTPKPVLERRYELFLDPVLNARVDSLKKIGQPQRADSLYRSFNYHVDHGDGMDCYSVGATLGGGTAALMPDGQLALPYCYKTCEILDNGPLRYSMRLVFNPLKVGSDSVVETRIVTLDKGTYLNRTEVRYDNLSTAMPVAAGIVIHRENPTGYSLSREKGYVAYADSTDNPRNNNGIIYIGVVFPDELKEACVQHYSPDEQKQHSGAMGHVLGISDYTPGSTFVYYWGSGWSKAGINSADEWNKEMENVAERLRRPLKITID